MRSSRGWQRVTLLGLLIVSNVSRRDTPSIETILEIPQDPESQLAAGERLDIQQADLYALQLISGISDVTAAAILTHRTQLRCKASQSGGHPLECIPGIGAVRARAFARFLRTSEPEANEH